MKHKKHFLQTFKFLQSLSFILPFVIFSNQSIFAEEVKTDTNKITEKESVIEADKKILPATGTENTPDASEKPASEKNKKESAPKPEKKETAPQTTTDKEPAKAEEPAKVEESAKAEDDTKKEEIKEAECLRCKRRTHVELQVLGFATPVGVTGISVTYHIRDRTSIQAGVGDGLEGYSLSFNVLNFFRSTNNLHMLAGLSLRTDEEDSDPNDGIYFEGLWLNLGLGGNYTTQTGLSYGVDVGLTLALFEEALSSDMRFCFGVLASDKCRQEWRILPYISLVKVGYSF